MRLLHPNEQLCLVRLACAPFTRRRRLLCQRGSRCRLPRGIIWSMMRRNNKEIPWVSRRSRAEEEPDVEANSWWSDANLDHLLASGVSSRGLASSSFGSCSTVYFRSLFPLFPLCRYVIATVFYLFSFWFFSRFCLVMLWYNFRRLCCFAYHEHNNLNDTQIMFLLVSILSLRAVAGEYQYH